MSGGLVPRQPDATPATASKGRSRMMTNQDRDSEARIQALIDQEQHDDDHEPGCASQSYPDPGICFCEGSGR
jgi:hypothetical protein